MFSITTPPPPPPTFKDKACTVRKFRKVFATPANDPFAVVYEKMGWIEKSMCICNYKVKSRQWEKVHVIRGQVPPTPPPPLF